MSRAILFIELLVLLFAAVPMLRLAVWRPLRCRFVHVSTALAAAVVVWISAIMVLALYLPAALHPLTALIVIALGIATWRARESYGRARRLPPGSLSLTDSIEAIVDREFYQKRAVRHGPIFKMSQFHRPVVCVMDVQRGNRLLREHEHLLGPCPQPFNREITGGFLRYMDNQTHRIYDPLFRRALSGRVMSRARPVIVENTGNELTMAAASARNEHAGSVDPEAYMDRIVHAAFLQALYGMTPGTQAYDQLTDAFMPLKRAPLSKSLGSSAKAALHAMKRLLLAQLEQLQSSRGHERVSVCAISELARLDTRMPDESCLNNLIFIHKIASGNILALMRWLLVMLGSNPQWITNLRTELEPGKSSGSPALVDRVVKETLRLSQSEYIYRYLKESVDLDGFYLPKNWLVRICVWESHRSTDHFDNPERFDPDRFLKRDFPRSAYSPFGAHRHACNGVALSHLICNTFLEELTRGYNWAVRGHERLERDFRHWSHWRPASDLRLSLKPVALPAASASASDHG